MKEVRAAQERDRERDRDKEDMGQRKDLPSSQACTLSQG